MHNQGNRLHSELVVLFGRQRVDMAEALDVVDMDITAPAMEAVEAAADALLKESGQPHRQRELVDDLDNGTALLLCMWLMDHGLPSHLVGDAA